MGSNSDLEAHLIQMLYLLLYYKLDNRSKEMKVKEKSSIGWLLMYTVKRVICIYVY